MAQLHTQEHADIMSQFERDIAYANIYGLRFDREPKHLWPQGQIYQNEETNIAFKAYRMGYAFGQARERRLADNRSTASPACESGTCL